jgi:PAS domain S-box-containing protein
MIDTALLDALPVAIYTTDAEGRITYYNESAAELWGCRPEIGTDRWCGSLKIYWPDGRRLPHDECPMAICLKEGRPVRGVETIAERPDGTRVRFMPFPSPLRDDAGQMIGAINLLMDLSERDKAQALSSQVAAIVESSDDAIVSKKLDGRVTSWNAGATRIFGYEASEMIGESITRIIPPELLDEEKDIIARLRKGERIGHFETVRVTKDGRRVDISLTVSPVRDALGNIVGASKVARDVTERKQAEKLQRLLVDELNHRVKNTLATIQAIASQSLHRAKSPADFVTTFSGRVQALARAHDLLTQKNLQGAEIMGLVREQVLYGGFDDNRVACTGPMLLLDPQSAMHLALILHELATNARKYGALSVPTGRLWVSWELRTNGERNLVLDWKERGGPRIAAPREKGFGSALIEQTVKGHGGKASIRYGAEGLTAHITFPLPEQAPMVIGSNASLRGSATPLLKVGADSGLAGKRVIIIEDEPLVSMDVESCLAAAGCEIAGTAGNLAVAKTLSATAECDVALLDVNLGGHQVDELAATLTRRNIPFAFVTGYGRDTLPQGFRDAVMVRKPFSADELIGVVERLVHQAPGVIPLRRKES